MRSLSGFMAAALLAACILSSGCNVSAGRTGSTRPTFADRVGEYCTVQFRRDALGAGANRPISPDTGTINGAVVNAHGNLVKATGEWIVIERNNSIYHIPVHAVLLVHMQKESPK